jgi:hypothetical protein
MQRVVDLQIGTIGLHMTIIYTMTLVGLLGLALHFELYWASAAIVVFFLFLMWRSSRKAPPSPPS